MAPPRKWSPVAKTCEADGCGREFTATTAYAITKQRFCSRGCSLPSVQKARRVRKVRRRCEQCGKVVIRVPSHFANRDHIFCSNRCRGRWRSESGEVSGENSATWKGGSSTWWKQKARERDDFTCQVDGCGVRDEGRGTHAHHKLPREASGPDELGNLITLCSEHHRMLEHRLYIMFLERYPKEAAILVQELYAPG